MSKTLVVDAPKTVHANEARTTEVDLTSFPLETLPARIRPFVEETALALPVPVDLVAVPALVMVGAAIGNSRWARVKEGWQESAAIFAAVVADSGSMKSPAQAAAVKPLRDAPQRTWTSDATVEALSELLAERRKGIALIRDELSGWVRAFNQYKGGHGADKEFYLSAWSGESFYIDRKGAPPLHVARPFLSVVGCIPPSVVPMLVDRRTPEDGFIERLLVAWPTPIDEVFSKATVSSQSRSDYHRVIETLLALDLPEEPTFLPLTSTAFAMFEKFVENNAQDIKADPALRGFYAKLKGYCVRLALIHALGSNPAVEAIGPEDIMAASAQVDYFKAQARKVVGALYPSVGVGTVGTESEEDRCKKWILNTLGKKGPLTKRDLQRCGSYPAATLNPALTSLLSPQLTFEGDTIYPYRHTDRPTDVKSDLKEGNTNG